LTVTFSRLQPVPATRYASSKSLSTT
jgi:hypothetical protein